MIADERNTLDLRLVAFIDLEDQVDAAALKLDDLGSTVASKRPWRR